MENIIDKTHVDKTVSKKKYSLDFKLSAITAAEKEGNRPVASRLNILESRICEWRQQKSKFIGATNSGPTAKKFRLDGGRRKVTEESIDSKLEDEIFECREQRLPVTCKWIMQGAKFLFDEKLRETDPTAHTRSFNASRDWLQKFMIRNKFAIRRRTMISQKLPADLIPKLTDFVIFVRQLQLKNNYALTSIFACDETAIWLDMLPDTTVDSIGVKQVPIKTTGQEKMRITVMLCAKANGSKCKPFVLLKRVRPLPALEKSFPQLNFDYNATEWMDNEQTKKFLRLTFGQISFSKRLLVWDAFPCHISDETKVYMKQLKADMAVIPAGCTGLIQPGDVCWNKPFKASLTDQYTEWLSSGDHEFTKAGNIKAAPLQIVCQWICKAWESLLVELIGKSFRCCGIALKTDGSEDSDIACFQDGNKCAAGKQMLIEKNDALLNSGSRDSSEINVIINDEDLDENNLDLNFFNNIASDEEIEEIEL